MGLPIFRSRYALQEATMVPQVREMPVAEARRQMW